MALKEQLLATALKREELSPIQRFRFESLLSDKFGRDGLRVYFLINGKNTVGQILAQTGIDDRKLLEMLKFASDSGIVRIEPTLLEDMPSVTAAPGVAPELAKEKAGVMPTLRSPVEKKIYDKFGQLGVDVYRLMDEVGTPEEILDRMAIPEAKLLEILGFLRGEGIISLEKPEEKEEEKEEEELPPILEEEPKRKKPAKPAEEEKEEETPKPREKPKEEKPRPAAVPKPAEKPAEEPAKPLGPAPAKPAEKEAPKGAAAEKAEALMQVEEEKMTPLRPVVLPIKRQLGLFGRLKIEAELLRRFGQPGMHLFSLVDGDRTSVKIVKASKCPMEMVDRVLDFLAAENAVDLHELAPDEIKERWGEEGLAIYEVYGRDGILIYDMIDKRATIKDIIVASRIPPKRGVEIFAFIHKILGLEIPLDVHVLYRQLGIE